MRSTELAYRSVPGIIIILGITALCFSSATYNLIQSPLYINLVFFSGLVLVADGILMVIVRRMDEASYWNDHDEQYIQESFMLEESIPDFD